MSIDLPSIALLRRYLEAHYWMPTAMKAAGYDLFVRNDPDFGVIDLIVPKHESVAGDERHTEQAIRTLADLNERTAEETIEDVRNVAYDLIEAVLPTPRVYTDSVSYRVADSFIRTSRQIMLNVATAEYDHNRAERPEQLGRKYADSCRFGHTRRGSFAFRIMSLVGPHDRNLAGEVDSPPPERRIVQRLARGLRAARQASDQQDPAPLIAMSDHGLKSGACFALAQMLDRSESDDLTFSFALSPEWRLAKEETAPHAVKLPTSCASIIREAAQELRVRPPLEPVLVQGRVETLTSKYQPADLLHPEGREIYIIWESADYGEIKVQVRLFPIAYMAASAAHIRGDEVAVRGMIEVGPGSSWRMLDVQEFRVVKDEFVGSLA